jgi:hypothetical protein
VAVFALAAPLLGYAALTWLLDPQRLGTALLRRAERASGVDLATATPATLGVWPRLHLELDGLTARIGSEPPLLAADRVEVALPLSVLWAERPPVGAVTVQAPRLDVAALQAWLRTRTTVASGAPPSLPTGLTIDMRDATVDGGDWRLEHGTIELRPQAQGAVRLSATARLHAGDLDLPVSAQLVGTPRGAAIEPLEITLSPAPGDAWLRVQGGLDYASDGLTIELRGRLHDQWPAPWPQPAPSLLPWLTARTLELRYRGAADLSAPLQLHSAGSDGELRVEVEPSALLAWWGAASRTPLPPGTVHAEQKTTRIGGLQIDGLQVDLDDEPAE